MMRQLFPTRIGFRLAEEPQINMLFGDGHRDLAPCDRIPEALPGVAYVWADGAREPTRVRAVHVTDADIAQMAAGWARVDVETGEIVDLQEVVS
jgi:S-DNA-T family DNA segregation ATPase FtsK/SpoIIIE